MTKSCSDAMSMLLQMQHEVEMMIAEVTVAKDVTPEQLDVISAAQASLFKSSMWVRGKSQFKPQTRVELPAETYWRERNDAAIAGRKAPDLHRGIPIS